MHNRITGNVVERRFNRDMARAPADNNAELGFIIDLPAHGWNDDRFIGSDNGIGVHSKQKRLFGRLGFYFLDMVFVIEPDTNEFLRSRDRRMDGDVRRVETVSLNGAGRPFQLSKLFLQEFQAVFYLQDFLNGGNGARKLQEVVFNRFGDVKASIAEGAPDAHDTRRTLPRKIHEFHECLL